jgi:hypothetical protein
VPAAQGRVYRCNAVIGEKSEQEDRALR